MGRIRALDGFRAISIVIVVLSHAQATVGFPGSLRPLLVAGAIGVHVFFVLSGYLITSLLLNEQATTGRIDLRNFYIRRFFRIVPALFVLVACVAVYDWQRGWQIPRAVYLNALTFTTGITPLRPGGRLLQHTWSLSVEEQFYLFWPLFFALSKPRTRYLVTVGILAVWPILRVVCYVLKLGFIVHSSLGWADAIMFGCAAAMIARDAPGFVARAVNFHPRVCRLGALIVFAVIAKLSSDGRAGLFTLPVGGSLMSAALAYLILAYTSDDRDWAGRFLTSRPVVGLGVLSYSLYLWQEPFTVEDLPGLQPFWKSFPVNVLFAMVFALLSYFLVEKPLMRFRRRFLTRPADLVDAAAPPASSARAF